MRIEILVYDGYDELDALGALTVLERAAAHGAGLAAEVVRLAGSSTVTSSFGLQLQVPRTLAPGNPPGLLIVPGAPWLPSAAGDAWAQGVRDRIAGAVAAVHAAGAALAAAGAGALVLEAAGVAADAALPAAAGVTAGLEVGLGVVERFASPTLAAAVARELGYARGGG